MANGTFGGNEYYEDKLRKRRECLARRLMYRELGVHMDSPTRTNKLISQVRSYSYLSTSNAHVLICRV